MNNKIEKFLLTLEQLKYLINRYLDHTAWDIISGDVSFSMDGDDLILKEKQVDIYSNKSTKEYDSITFYAYIKIDPDGNDELIEITDREYHREGFELRHEANVLILSE